MNWYENGAEMQAIFDSHTECDDPELWAVQSLRMPARIDSVFKGRLAAFLLNLQIKSLSNKGL